MFFLQINVFNIYGEMLKLIQKLQICMSQKLQKQSHDISKISIFILTIAYDISDIRRTQL